MTPYARKAALIFLSGALINSCNSNTTPDVTISGSVFIVTQGGPSIKLGLVEVGCISEDDMIRHIASRDSAAVLTEARLKTLVEDNIKAIGRAQKKIETARIAKKEAADRFRARGSFANSRIRSQKNADFSNAEKEKMSAEEDYTKAVAALENLRTSPSYLGNLPEPFVSSKTNADGEFSFTLPLEERVAVTAQASRTFLDGTTERYFWLIWLMPDEGGSLMLSNDNMLSTECANCVLAP